jgi:hypothetical protein
LETVLGRGGLVLDQGQAAELDFGVAVGGA